MGEFGIGQSASGSKNPRPVRGEGRYRVDVDLPPNIAAAA